MKTFDELELPELPAGYAWQVKKGILGNIDVILWGSGVELIDQRRNVGISPKSIEYAALQMYQSWNRGHSLIGVRKYGKAKQEPTKRKWWKVV